MFCPKCGAEILGNDKFCSYCGFKISEENTNIVSPQDVSPDTSSQTPVQSKSQQKNKTVKVVIATVAVAFVITAVLLIRNISETKEMREALKNNDAVAIYNIYEIAIGDEKLIGKYEELISDKISEIYSDLNEHDCSEDAKTMGSDAFFQYANSKYGGLIGEGSDVFEDVACWADETAYNNLAILVESKFEYYDGIYHLSNAEDVFDYEEAIREFSAVCEEDKFCEDAGEKIIECSELYLETVLKTVEEYIADDDISGAIEILSSAKDFFDSEGLDSTEIQSKIATVIAEYAKKYADKADAAFKEKDVNTAIGNIKVAIELQPENADYQVKMSEYEQYLPFELYKDSNVLEYEENGDFWGTLSLDNTYTANDGTEMPHSIIWYNNSDDASVSMSAIYNLQGKYDVVTGQIFLPEAEKSTDFEGYFVVYGDGKKIYTSPVVTSGVVPQDVSFEVSDIQTLEIAFFGQGTGGFLSTSPDFGVSNLVAQKAFPEE